MANFVAAGESTTGRLGQIRRRDLCLSTTDGIWYGLMVGIAETYFAAFAISLKLHVLAIGMVATMPILLGSILQLASPWGLRRFAAYRRWVVASSLLQVLSLWSLVPLALLNDSISQGRATLWLFTAATIYWAGGLAASPAWNAWMEKLVPARVRPKYFACRTKFVQIAVVTGIVLAGGALNLLASNSQVLFVFAAIFALGGACRLVSVFSLARQSEVSATFSNSGVHRPRLRDWETMCAARPGSTVRWITSRPRPILGLRSWFKMFDGWSQETRRLVFFLLLVQAAMYVSVPFFTPYMLNELALGHGSFMMLTALNFVGKVIALPFLGRLAKRLGPYRLLWICSLGIAPISCLWTVSANVYYLCSLQVLAGVIWAGYELAILLLFFQSIPSVQRVSVLTLFNFGNSLAMVGGSALGGWLLTSLGTDVRAFFAVFVASSLLRFTALIFCPKKSEAVVTEKATMSERSSIAAPERHASIPVGLAARVTIESDSPTVTSA